MTALNVYLISITGSRVVDTGELSQAAVPDLHSERPCQFVRGDAGEAGGVGPPQDPPAADGGHPRTAASGAPGSTRATDGLVVPEQPAAGPKPHRNRTAPASGRYSMELAELL